MIRISPRPPIHDALSKLVLMISLLAGPVATAQSYTVLHDFTGGNDGGVPFAGLTQDAAGNFFGTTTIGGLRGLGTAYRLVHAGDAWRLYGLYAFDGLDNLRDGIGAYAGVVIGADDSLYGTTRTGGQGNGCAQRYGCGTVFRVRPGAAIAPWNEAILHGFGTADGSNPDHGNLVLDHAGNLFGTTRNGGAYSQGTVFELTSSGGIWTETVLHNFSGQDGASPLSGVTFDSQGNLYGTTSAGGANGVGTVYRLKSSGSGWTEEVLYSFTNGADGSAPAAGLVIDAAGNLFGATTTGGAAAGGTVFEVSPSPGGGWNVTTLTALSGSGGPSSNLILDASGNLYSTTSGDGGQGLGSVFELTWSNGAWSYRSLHDFFGGADGATPYSSLVLDAHGNLLGTASAGGAYGQGVIFQIAP